MANTEMKKKKDRGERKEKKKQREEEGAGIKRKQAVCASVHEQSERHQVTMQENMECPIK